MHSDDVRTLALDSFLLQMFPSFGSSSGAAKAEGSPTFQRVNCENVSPPYIPTVEGAHTHLILQYWFGTGLWERIVLTIEHSSWNHIWKHHLIVISLYSRDGPVAAGVKPTPLGTRDLHKRWPDDQWRVVLQITFHFTSHPYSFSRNV